MTKFEIFIFGFFFGAVSAGFYIYYVIKFLKKNDYLNFGPTKKLTDKLNEYDKESPR